MLTFADATIGYGQKVIIKDFNLTIAPGQKICLLGKSGSGKSTILKTLWNETDVLSGTVSNQFDEQSVIFQHDGLFEWLTVRENLMIAAPQTSEHQLQELAAKLQIDNLLDAYCSKISGGQQQRVQIARALLSRSQLLLIDEPTSSLDMVNKAIFASLLVDNLYQETAILLVTHDLDEAVLIADQIVVIDDGQVLTAIENIPSELRNRKSAEFSQTVNQLREVIVDENN